MLEPDAARRGMRGCIRQDGCVDRDASGRRADRPAPWGRPFLACIVHRAPCTVDGADQRGMLPPDSRRIGTELFHVKRRALPSLDTTGIDPRSEANDPRESGCPSPLAPASCGGHPSVSTHCPTLLLALRSVRCSARPSCPRSAGRSLLPPQVTCHLRSSSWCRVTDLRRACGTAPRASQGYRQRRRQRACSQVRAWVSPQVCKGMSTPRPGC